MWWSWRKTGPKEKRNPGLIECSRNNKVIYETKDDIGVIIVDEQIRECLAASLTILIKLKVLDVQEVGSSLDKKDLDELFWMLNEKYKEISQD